jgi:hypothetical protein
MTVSRPRAPEARLEFLRYDGINETVASSVKQESTMLGFVLRALVVALGLWLATAWVPGLRPTRCDYSHSAGDVNHSGLFSAGH